MAGYSGWATNQTHTIYHLIVFIAYLDRMGRDIMATSTFIHSIENYLYRICSVWVFNCISGGFDSLPRREYGRVQLLIYDFMRLAAYKCTSMPFIVLHYMGSIYGVRLLFLSLSRLLFSKYFLLCISQFNIAEIILKSKLMVLEEPQNQNQFKFSVITEYCYIFNATRECCLLKESHS